LAAAPTCSSTAGPLQDESGTADVDWFVIPNHAGVGRFEDAARWPVPTKRHARRETPERDL